MSPRARAAQKSSHAWESTFHAACSCKAPRRGASFRLPDLPGFHGKRRLAATSRRHREPNQMRYLALACDYDGTLAHHGRVGPSTVAALEKLRASGRKLILVTGRELDELIGIFPEITFF